MINWCFIQKNIQQKNSFNLSEYTVNVLFWFYNVTSAQWLRTFECSRRTFYTMSCAMKRSDDAAVVVRINEQKGKIFMLKSLLV